MEFNFQRVTNTTEKRLIIVYKVFFAISDKRSPFDIYNESVGKYLKKISSLIPLLRQIKVFVDSCLFIF